MVSKHEGVVSAGPFEPLTSIGDVIVVEKVVGAHERNNAHLKTQREKKGVEDETRPSLITLS